MEISRPTEESNQLDVQQIRVSPLEQLSEATVPLEQNEASSSNNNVDGDIIKYTETILGTIANASLEKLRQLIKRITKDAAEQEVLDAFAEIEMLVHQLNSQQLSIVKQALSMYEARGNLDLSQVQRHEEIFRQLLQSLLQPEASSTSIKEPKETGEISTENSLEGPGNDGKSLASLLSKHIQRTSDRKWSDSWKLAVKGVLQKQRRERVRETTIRKMQTVARKIVPKSDATKEHLRCILSGSYLFGDLDPTLREEIIDAFQDVRVSPRTKVVKQGDEADNFYVIDIGEFDVLRKKGNEPQTLLKSIGPGDVFGELALMYESPRNATVKATTHALVWAVDRTTFKSIMSRHLTGSPIAQVLREAPVLKKLSTKEIVNLSSHSIIQTFHRGEHVLRSGTTMDKVCIIQEGQVRLSCDSSVSAHSSRLASGGTIAKLNRLEILGEALLLNDENVILWNFIASSDHASIIMIERSSFSPESLNEIRKDLQVQLVALGLQRVPAFLELSSDQLYRLAEGFTESVHTAGEEITKAGDVMASESRIYVMQSGSVFLSKSSPDDDMQPTTPRNTHTSFISATRTSRGDSTGSGFWGSRLGSLLKSSSPQSPRSSNILTAAITTQDLINISQGLATNRTKSGGSPRQSIGASSPWKVMTYGVFGDECLLSRAKSKEDDYWPPCQTTATVDSLMCICLSVTISDLTTILGPIQEVLTRITNLKILRKVPCLEYLTDSEIDMLSYSVGLRTLQPGETLYRAGDAGDRMYIISKGTVIETVHFPTIAGKMKGDQTVLSKGSFFGEDALLSDGPRPATMVAGVADGTDASGARLYYLDKGVIEASLGPLIEINETRKEENEKRGIVRTIQFEELDELGLLGTGLFGKVKLVYCRRMRDYYALKCVSKAKVMRLQEEEHLRNEKIFMSELDHPFITKLIRTYKDATHIYLLQELNTGRELFLYMEKTGRLKEWEAAFYAGGVLLALEYMHSKGIVYRDLKPENTLIGDNGYPKLIDLGFAKRIYNRRTYSMCGTPDYMAPEIIRRQGHGKAVDYWALGCLIFELITNTSVFNRGDDPPQLVFQRIIEGRIRFPPYVSADAVDIIRKLLDPNPETRLGCRKRGSVDIKEHPFFAKQINFQLLIRRKEDPPMIPPKVDDYSMLCINEEEEMDPLEDFLINPRHNIKWDDIF